MSFLQHDNIVVLIKTRVYAKINLYYGGGMVQVPRKTKKIEHSCGVKSNTF